MPILSNVVAMVTKINNPEFWMLRFEMVHILRDIAGKCVVHMTKCDVLGSWKIYFTTRIIEEKKVFAYKGYHGNQ